MTHYVEPAPQPTPRADVIRRQDVIDGISRVVDVYQEQQIALLGQVQQAAQHGTFSSGEQIRERRWTSGMYLGFYAFVVALAVMGMTAIAYRYGLVDGYNAFAAWLVGTGAFALWLAWKRHGQELEQTPEAVARHIIDWHGSVAEYDAHTRRKALRWEFEAEERRQQAAMVAAESGRQDAQLRIAEMEARRRLVNTQNDAAHAWAIDPPAITHHPSPITPPAVPDADALRITHHASPSTWQQDLAVWLASLYTDPDAITEAGVIKGRTPWAQRSPWLDADKTAARRACCDLRPAIIVPADGGRWRLRVDMFPHADIAVRLLSQRLADP